MQKHLFARTERVTLQLSNLCNYACAHDRCPAHHQKKLHILPAAVVRDVIDGLAVCDYGADRLKWLAWHIYNEPLNDPRLVEFVRYARGKLPKVQILVWTNGWYLNHVLMAEMTAAGVDRWHITAHTQKEQQRLQGVVKGGPCPKACQLMGGKLDDRMHASPPSKRGCCLAPLRDLCIYPTGELGLCCFDILRAVTFADLNNRSFLEVFAECYPKLLAAQQSLSRCQPLFDPCAHCAGGR